jgi:rod shape-determining protein MreD
MVWGLIGGLMIDLVSGAPLGISTLPLMAAAMVAGAGRARIFPGNMVLPALVSLLAIALYQVIWLISLMVVGQPVTWRVGIVQIAAPLLLLNMVLMPVIYFGMLWLARLMQGARVRLG